MGLRGKTSVTAHWTFSASPEAVWRVIADSARVNEVSGLPRYSLVETVQEDGTVSRIGSARLGRYALEWEEPPCEWVEGAWFQQDRILRRGPVRFFSSRYTIEPTTGGTRVTYLARTEPAGWAGGLLLVTRFLEKFAAGIEQRLRELLLRQDVPVPPEVARVSAAGRARAEAAAAKLATDGHLFVDKLLTLVLGDSEAGLERIRPLELAARWQAPRRPVIELCLAAVKAELLTARWDLLCPRCRGAKLSAASLDQLPSAAHCGACNISYDRDFARNVELVFQPCSSIRPIGPGAYCLSGPMSTPHVAIQVAVDPGSRGLAASLPPGSYRIRTVEAGAEFELDLAGAIPDIKLLPNSISVREATDPGTIEIRNSAAARRTLVIERREWVKDALTAHAATTLQSFRDLFSTDTLKPGDDVAIDHVTLMFTDLKGSTSLYARLGDAAAYRLVRRHYAFLARMVREHDGAVVKTIGDAIMAVFAEPANGVRAALAIQRGITLALGSDPEPVMVRLGLHAGSCMGVTMNDRLDYFGTTVNLAARLEQQADGGDIVLSQPLAADPAIAPLLDGLPLTHESAQLRGFDAPTSFIRIAAAGRPDTSPPP